MVLLPTNYPQLQNLIKRDPASYETEFQQQYHHFKASLAIVQLRPAAADDHFESLLSFLSHVVHCYAEARTQFPGLVFAMLAGEAVTLNPSLRRALVQALLLLRKHGLVELVPLLELFFRLLRLADKALREMLTFCIVAEVRRANHPHRNNALNRTLQNFMYGLFEEAAAAEQKAGSEDHLAVDRILHVLIELYRKRIWNDARTVNVVADAAIKRISPKVLATSLNFFVGRFRGKALASERGDSGDDSDAEDEDVVGEYKGLLQKTSFNGTGKKRSTGKKIKKALNAIHRKEHKQHLTDQNGSFSAIQLLNDPQGFAERLFSHLQRSVDTFESKMLLMNVVSRVIGSHKLLLLDFYSFLLRYIQPHQKEVTHILAYAAQATHEFVPVDDISPILAAITRNFASEHCNNEVIAVGLNGIREICARCPGAMSADVLQDLAGFKGYHDKGVVIAARSLIALYRDLNPELLHRRDRGKEVSIAMKRGGPLNKTVIRSNHLDATGVKGITIEPTKLPGEEKDMDTTSLGDEEEEFLGLVSDDEEEEFQDDEEENLSEEGSDRELDQDQACENDPQVIKPIKTRKIDVLSEAATKVFSTPADFARLRKRMAGGEASSDESSSNESKNDSDGRSQSSEDSGDDMNEVVDPRSLESRKKSKQDYAARMASIQTGREGRLKFGSRKGKHHEKSSMSNRVKEKSTKNALMLVHKSSVRAKKRRSSKEAQQSRLKHRKKQKNRR